jgi:oligopeptide/dipeptide ABC transporter ATP-binding protein
MSEEAGNRGQEAVGGAEHPLLEVRDLKTWFGDTTAPIRAVDGVSFVLRQGQTAALVGESGCGKSVTALSLTRLIPQPPARYAGGEVLFNGVDVLRMNERRLCALRGAQIAYVFQDPTTALNPTLRIGWQVREAVRLHRPDADARAEALSLLDRVGLAEPARQAEAYPHELSGGMRQRVMIAMALACRPGLLVADEPTTALDVTVQAQILDLLDALRQEFHMAVLLITHNLGLVAENADRVHVMYAGRIVEAGPAEDVLRRPAHPYTRGLLDAAPRLTGDDWHAGRRREGIPGSVPHPARLPRGCAFAPRCPRAQPACTAAEPALTPCGENRQVRCLFPLA